MKEIVVDVTTLKQWKSTLDVWFKQGHTWLSGDKDYHEEYFDYGERKLLLTVDNDIQMPSDYAPYIEYSDFMSQQQKEDNKMETYYVTQGKLNVIEKLKSMSFPLYQLLNEDEFHSLSRSLDDNTEKALLRYIGGDETIELKVKEQLYRLWRIDDEDDKIYMRINSFGTPDSTIRAYQSFTASLDEITKWKTPAWSVEEVD